MIKRLPETEKERILRRILDGEQVARVSREEKVSRTILYRWLRRKNEKKNVKPRWNSLHKKIEKKIVSTAIKNPSYTIARISSIACVSNHGVWNVLKRYGLNTREARTDHISRNGVSMIKPVVVTDRVSMIRRYEAGDKASDICRDFGISHTLFYRFLKRYQKANKERSALENFRPKGEKHWRYTPGIEEIVLKIVAEKPELTPSALAVELRERKGESLIGAHGIYNLLKRLDLNTYEKRRLYADSQGTEEKQFRPIPTTTLPAAPQYSFISFLSPPFLKRVFSNKKSIGIALISSLIFFSVLILTSNVIFQTQGFVAKIGIIFSLASLFFGLFFFLYSIKYYISIAIVLSYSRREKGKGSVGGFLSRVFGVSIEIEVKSSPEEKKSIAGVGFQSDLSDVRLERNPFVSIHVGTYNEKRVIDRLLTACTSFDYPNYEVIVADDSNDETVDLINKWAHNPRIKISHRDNRDGYKGAALAEALKKTDKRAEYVMVFDADFIPYPDTITQFLKYFQKAAGTLDFSSVVIPSEVEGSNNTFAAHGSEIPPRASLGRNDKGSNIAAVQGYQWHVLNKSENWITRGVRSEYAGSYVIERSGAELYSGLKQISGSVYMIRRNVLQEIGWGRSITEDFELTLKLYEAGYKVIYTPYIQAPAEAVSTVKRLIRQRMRWAEGHSFNIKRMLVPLLFGRWIEDSSLAFIENSKFKITNSKQIQNTNEQNSKESRVFVSSPLTFAEKMELVYLAPYYLQAAFFIVGTFCWFAAEAIFQVRLPFWTEVWGWSLIITNLLALPFLNLIGLFMEEAEEKDYLGLLSFVVISYVVAPFQAYAAVKGFFEDEEGPWFRTPKTGRITDIFTPGRFYRYVRGIFGKPVQEYQMSNFKYQNSYLSLATANNVFHNFRIKKKNVKWVGNLALVIVLGTSIMITNFAPFLPESNRALASESVLRMPERSKSEFGVKNNPKNKDEILKNVIKDEIIVPRAIMKKTIGGKNLEFIFRKEAWVRIKLEGQEMEVITKAFGGKTVSPKKSYIYKNREVIYEEVAEGVDLKYTFTNDMITEEFILKNDKAFEGMKGYDIVQTITVTNAKIVSPDPSSFGFYSKDGRELFRFSSPFAKDKKGEVSNDLSFSLKKDVVGYKLIKTLGASAVNWLADPARVYPVSIDPSVIITGGIEEGEVQYGGLQRKLAYANGAWYAFYNCDANPCTAGTTGGRIYYQKSIDGTSWGGYVQVDSGDTDNYNPSVAVSGNIIHIWWIDDGTNNIEGRMLDTTTDTLGTACTSVTAAAGISNTFTVSVAELTATSAVVAFSDTTATASDVDIYIVTGLDGTCSVTDVQPGAITFGTQGSGITGSDRPVLFGIDSTHAGMVFQDGDLSFSYFDASRDEWRRNNQQIANVTDDVYSVLSDGTNFWVLTKTGTGSTSTDTGFYKCCTASTGAVETSTAIDTDIGGAAVDTSNSVINMDCITATDCKIVYIDALDTSAPILMFVDCDNADCSSKTSTNIDSDVGSADYGGSPGIFCPTATNCKIVYGDNMAGNFPDAVFVDCGDATCSGTSGTCTSGTRTCTVVNSDIGGELTEFRGDVFCPSDVSNDTDCKFIFFSGVNASANDVIWFADCSNASCSTRDALTSIVADMNDDTSDVITNMSLWCNASADCQVLFHDAVNGDLTLRDCSNSACSAANATTDIDSDVGANVAGVQSISVPNAIDCSAGATDCKIVYADGSQNEFNFVDCSAAGCTSSTITKIDDTAGGIMNHNVSLYCVAADDCKGTYVGYTTGGSEDTYFFDCDSAACVSGSVVDLNTAPFMSAVDCVGGTGDCKIVYYGVFVSTTDVPVNFADCTNAKCLPEWSSETAPWTSQTNTISSVSLNLDTTNNNLYASIIKDSSEQAYWKMTAKASTSWGSESSYGFTAGDLGYISSNEKGAGDTQIGVVTRRGTNFEFATIPEKSIFLIVLLPFIPKLFRKLKEDRKLRKRARRSYG